MFFLYWHPLILIIYPYLCYFVTFSCIIFLKNYPLSPDFGVKTSNIRFTPIVTTATAFSGRVSKILML